MYLDNPTAVSHNHAVLVPDGFPGQRMLVMPRPRVREFLHLDGTPRLVVTDCGYFPRAQSHGRRRLTPIPQAVVMACVDGAGWVETEAGRFAVSRGDVVVLPPGRPHSYGADADDPWTLWWFHAAGPDVETFLRRSGLTADAPVRHPGDLYRVASLLSEILQWMERDTTTTSLNLAAGAAWHALTLIAAERSRADGTQDTVEHAMAYLRGHLAEPVSVPELAAMASLSASHFSAVFKRHTGYAVLQYLTMLRMARARELLDITAQPVSSVAAEVGYPDAFYFARQFRKMHGMTPREYRNQHKG